MRIALVHDWLTGMRGGEKVLEALCELFPEADLFTLLHNLGSVSPTIEKRRIVTSMLQRLPGVSRGYRYYLPLMPTAIEGLDLLGYDLVVSSSHCVAKGVITRSGAVHVCYSHTPMRYAWDQASSYFPPDRRINRLLVPPLLGYLRSWDVASASRVDRFVANSTFVAQRIRRYYRRSSTVVHPPVDTDFFRPRSDSERGGYLIVSALVPYKNLDLAIRAFNALGRPLSVIGRGPMEKSLRALAGPTIEFAGWVSDEELRDRYASCRALIMPAVEDFGICPLEANACGRPVIALGQGGALDSVVPLDPDSPGDAAGPTGILYPESDVDGLRSAVLNFESYEGRFSPGRLRAHAERFDRKVFKQEMHQLIEQSLTTHA